MKIKIDHKYETLNGNVVKIVYCCHGSSYPHIGYVVSKKKSKKREYHSWSNFGVCCNSNKGLTFSAFAIKETLTHERAKDTDGGEWADRSKDASWFKEGSVTAVKSNGVQVTGTLAKSLLKPSEEFESLSTRPPYYFGLNDVYIEMWVNVKGDYDIFHDLRNCPANLGDLIVRINKESGHAAVFVKTGYGFEIILKGDIKVPLNAVACISLSRVDNVFCLYLNGEPECSVSRYIDISNIVLSHRPGSIRSYKIAMSAIDREQAKLLYQDGLKVYGSAFNNVNNLVSLETL